VASAARRAIVAALAAIVAALALVYVVSEWRVRRIHEVAGVDFVVERTAEARERGRHLATAVAQCAFCHGQAFDGLIAVDDWPVGRLYAANLTPGRGGVGARYAAADWVRAIRFGVRPDGRSLLVMPSDHLTVMSDDDLGDLIAFLESLAAVDREWPERRVGPLTRLALVAGLAPEILPAERIPSGLERPDPGSAPSAALGAYLVALGSCRVCHRDDLRGGLHPLSLPGEPPPPDLTTAGPLADWSEPDFFRAMRKGRTPDGRALDPTYMPWPHYAGLRDAELRAILAYLRTVETPDGSRSPD